MFEISSERSLISCSIYSDRFISAKSPEVMLAFYRRLFPYKPFYLWLNQEHGQSFGLGHQSKLSQAKTKGLFTLLVPSKLFTHREFAFTLGESTYVRYNSFNNVEDFKREILRANPTRFEIGPIYNVRVSRSSVMVNRHRFAKLTQVWDSATGP